MGVAGSELAQHNKQCRMQLSSLLTSPLLLALPVAFLAGRWSAANKLPPPIKLGRVEPDVVRHLYSPPAAHGVVSIPSVVRDARGAVHNLMIGSFRFNVLETRAGVARSGDVHRSDQLDFVFKGRVSVTTREGGVDVTRNYGAGDFLVIPAFVPHIFRFLNETVMAEWWSGPFEARYYRPYRAEVDGSLQRAGGATQSRE